MFKVPEQYRLRKGLMSSSEADGRNGCFIIPHFRIKDYLINCVVSDGGGWQHVSITLSNKAKKSRVERCPTWEEMCWIKDLFWTKDECVMQLHPPEEDYVNNHSFCLHLWKPDNQEIPQPPSIMVGLPGISEQNLKR